ncbi:uncharacterized protein LY89DRAFT_779557 [Mollisia scopiformis]|uniref:Uncharacterized protein n=1 Tax=Mollisia scopiformis TaxID=149040 RepID=A0A194XIM9_MOLSC|nr:uncharacterized protein LY89DRAFT_779557 [Mollisia scopiformis]KUJ19622.1 hypothetical protein LY89DRAFT_779557 [Mollisia scopiformis]
MPDPLSQVRERHHQDLVESKGTQGPRNAATAENNSITRKPTNSEQKVSSKQNPAGLPRNKSAPQHAHRQPETKSRASQPMPPSIPPRRSKANEEGHIGKQKQANPKQASPKQASPKQASPKQASPDVEQRPKAQSSQHDGDPAQFRRLNTQSRGEIAHKKQLSKERLDEISRPKHITPKKVDVQKGSRPQTERKAARPATDQKAMAKQRAVELPFNDQWTKSKIEREEEIRGPPGMYVQRIEQNVPSFDAFSGLTSFLGWDNKRQHAMEMEINNLEKRLWHSQKKNEELKYNMSELSQTNDALQDDLRKVQQKSFNQMTKSAWTPLEDRAIQEVLEEIHQDIEAWAEDNCVESFDEIKGCLDETHQAALLEICKNVADVTQDGLGAQFQWWEERDVDPILLLTALSTFQMYSCVFNNEFLAMEVIVEDSMGTMVDVYRKLAELDSKQAHVWRSQLMRIIVGTPRSSGRFDGISSEVDVSDFIKRYCAGLIEEFEERPEAAFLKTKLSVESRESLLGCWTRAAEVFAQLQTQVAKVQWSANEHLRSTVNPRYVESHRSQAFPKGRNDGKAISLVISPMVVFFGNEDGEKYEVWRAVCKATVLVIEEEIENEETEEESEGQASEEETEEETSEDKLPEEQVEEEL